MWALSLKPASSWNWYRGFSTSTCLARFLRGTLGSATGASWTPLLRLYTNRSGSRKQFVLQFLKKVDWVLATRDMSQVKPSGTTPFSWLSFTPTFALGRSPIQGPSLTGSVIHAGSQPCFCQVKDTAWATRITEGKEHFMLAPVTHLSHPALPPAAVWCRWCSGRLDVEAA